MTFLCVMNVIKVSRTSLHFSEVLCISLHFSVFLYISLNFSVFLCISLNFSEFTYISLHFTCYFLGHLTERNVVLWTPFLTPNDFLDVYVCWDEGSVIMLKYINNNNIDEYIKIINEVMVKAMVI